MTARVVGIDPSLTSTGIAAADGALSTVGGDSKVGDRRLARIADAVALAVADADLVVLELLPQHMKSAGITGMAQGVIRLALVNACVPYVFLQPSLLKKYATGRGAADKADMRMALYQRTGVDVRDDNQVDAWWLRAAGLQHLGEPVVKLPAAQVAVLDKVAWPADVAAVTA